MAISLPRTLAPLAPLTAALALLSAAPALARATRTTSSNWSGYALHRREVSFTAVSGTWRVSSAVCSPGEQTYSSSWVGLGGYNPSAQALEQIGTETDCTATGAVITSAWYELVPEASVTIGRRALTVRPGDLVHGSVSAQLTRGSWRVRVRLADYTTGRSFERTLKPSLLDLSSAEWIEEAPSRCDALGDCQVLPLADFVRVAFSGARAVDRSGHAGSISSPRWTRTAIYLVANGGRRYVGQRQGTLAAPSPLRSKGRAFTITYEGQPPSTPPATPTYESARVAALPWGEPARHLQPGGARAR